MTAKSVLVIDPGQARRGDIAKALAQLNGGKDVVVTAKDGVDADDADDGVYDLVIADYDRLSVDDRAYFLLRYEKERRAGRMLLFTATWDRKAFAAMFGEQRLMNVVASDRGVRVEDLAVTLDKILMGQIFGLDRYFPPSARRWRTALKRSSERHGVLAHIVSTLEESGLQARFVEQLRLAADELLTNAFFNAPTDDKGERPYAATHRSEEVVLPDDRGVEVEVATVGGQVGLLVADGYGSLSPSTIVGYLGKCLRAGADQVDEKDGGAGLGLFYVFEAVSHFVINVAPTTRTEMIGVLDASVRYREFASRPKSLNVFVEAPRA